MSTPEIDPAAVLALPMQPNDAGAHTIRDYLSALLAKVWVQGEDFSAKRPFGNSGWQWDVYRALVVGGVIYGRLDEDGCLDDCDDRTGYQIIQSAIKHLGVTR